MFNWPLRVHLKHCTRRMADVAKSCVERHAGQVAFEAEYTATRWQETYYITFLPLLYYRQRQVSFIVSRLEELFVNDR